MITSAGVPVTSGTGTRLSVKSPERQPCQMLELLSEAEVVSIQVTSMAEVCTPVLQLGRSSLPHASLSSDVIIPASSVMATRCLRVSYHQVAVSNADGKNRLHSNL